MTITHEHRDAELTEMVGHQIRITKPSGTWIGRLLTAHKIDAHAADFPDDSSDTDYDRFPDLPGSLFEARGAGAADAQTPASPAVDRRGPAWRLSLETEGGATVFTSLPLDGTAWTVEVGRDPCPDCGATGDSACTYGCSSNF